MDGISINLESSSVEVLIYLEDDTNGGGTSSDHKNPNLKRKRRFTSHVWSTFEMLPLGVDGKQRCKCKDLDQFIFVIVNMVLGIYSTILKLV